VEGEGEPVEGEGEPVEGEGEPVEGEGEPVEGEGEPVEGEGEPAEGEGEPVEGEGEPAEGEGEPAEGEGEPVEGEGEPAEGEGEPAEGEGEPAEGEGEPEGIQAFYSMSAATGDPPLLVSFTDESVTDIGDIETWAWDFGDGAVSDAQHPEHIYEDPGYYAVKLTVTSPAGASTLLVDPAVVVNLSDGTPPPDPAEQLPRPLAASLSGGLMLGAPEDEGEGEGEKAAGHGIKSVDGPLFLRTIGGTVAVDEETGAFDELPAVGENVSQAVYMENEAGVLLGVAYLPPVSAQKADGVTFDADAFALGLIRFHPYINVLAPQHEALIMQAVMEHPDYPAFAASIVTVITDADYAGLSFANHPELFEDALRIGFEAMYALDEEEEKEVSGKHDKSDALFMLNVLDAPGPEVTLVNPYLCFYGVDFGVGNVYPTVLRGPKRAYSPEVWYKPWTLSMTPPYQRNHRLPEGPFTVTFHKGMNASVPGWSDVSTAQGLATWANFTKLCMAALKSMGLFMPVEDNHIERFLATAPNPDFDIMEIVVAMSNEISSFEIVAAVAGWLATPENWNKFAAWVWRATVTNEQLALHHDQVGAALLHADKLLHGFRRAFSYASTYVLLPERVSNQYVPFLYDLLFGAPPTQTVTFFHEHYALQDMDALIPPYAFFNVDSLNPLPFDSINFDTAGSTPRMWGNKDAKSDGLEFRWDFNGNGQWNTGWSANATEQFAYATPGVYRPRLEARDANGLTAIYARDLPVGEREDFWAPPVLPGEMLPVPAGWFEMGRPYTDTGDSFEVPVHDVYLDAYQIGKYPVTNQEYADVLNWALAAGYLTNSSGGAYTGGLVYAYGLPIADTASNSDYSQITYSGGVFGVRSRTGHNSQSFSMADHPMVRVSWYGAVAYCNWLSTINGLQPCYDTSNWTRYEPARNGYRLPTEAEWERAAAWDGSKHWRYGMTSDTIDITRANYYDGSHANPLGLTSTPYTSPVGWYNGVNPARLSAPGTLTVNATSPVGAYDMSGNVWEWCHDWWYRVYTTDPVSNPTGPGSGSYRVLRGGYWGNDAPYCRAAHRGRYYPDDRYSSNGFRVARASD
ncbi:MAG TPA: PKD domain-containing protein, partial [Candidatus Hydrogenedentes bacterium]|nr:PKD domain-containing protein [Candidatus Hydrogenedentota bacterium]